MLLHPQTGAYSLVQATSCLLYSALQSSSLEVQPQMLSRNKMSKVFFKIQVKSYQP